MAYFIRDDSQLQYEIHGVSGDPWIIFLHHGLGSSRSWRNQIDFFVQNGYQVLTYSRRGYGGSSRIKELDLPNFARDVDDLEALMDSLSIPKAYIVGHSDGGTIGLYFAAQHPQRVNKLTVMAAHIYIEPKMKLGIDEVYVRFNQDPEFRRGMHRNHGDDFENVLLRWYEGWLKIDQHSWDMRPILGEITALTLVIQGEEDEHATPQHAMDIANAIPISTLWLMKGAKHMIPQENAVELNEKLLRFIRRGKL